MTETILISIICSVFAALLTYFITSLTGKKSMVEAVSSAVTTSIKHHEAVFHKDETASFVKNAINEHKINCAGASTIHKIEKVVLALFISNGGKIEDLDL